MQRRIIAILLILVFVFAGFQGCSSKKEQTVGQKAEKNQEQSQNKKEKSKVPVQMGRFMEQKIEFPKLEDNENVIKILQSTDKQIELYTKVKGKFKCYRLQDDMSWKSSNAEWLNNGKINGSNVEIDDICCGEDGNYYICYVDYGRDTISHILKSSDKGKTSKEIKIPYLTKVQKAGDKYSYPMIRKINVLKNGNLVLNDLQNNNSLLIFSPNGEKIDKLPVATLEDLAYYKTSGNKIITISEDKKSIIIYNTESKSTERTIEYNVKGSSMAFTEEKNGTVLMGDSDGIHRMNKDGTLWETMVDGALNSMSMPSLYYDGLFVTGETDEQYYASYQNTNGGSSSCELLHYVFDQNVSAVPANEITVYSLKENRNIRQAISLFQAENADIKINYVVAMGEDDGILSDYVRALNTELLAGKGADILVLDGLPVESYKEKGVLADISDIVKQLKDAGQLLPNIADSYMVAGKAYQMPMRFCVPIIIGSKEAASSISNLNSVVGYIQKNQNVPYTSSMTYRYLLQNFLALYSKDLFQNGKLAEDKLVTFLNNLKIISDNIKATETDKNNNNTMSDFLGNDYLFRTELIGTIKNDISVSLSQLTDLPSASMAYTVEKYNKRKKFASMNQLFSPTGIIGLNNASKEKDTAKKFISFLFSKELQDANLYDGFPVNPVSLKKWLNEENDSTFGYGDNKGNTYEGTWPNKEQRENIQKLIENVKTPIEINQTINSIIINEVLPFFTGKKDANQVASVANSKISTYLAE